LFYLQHANCNKMKMLSVFKTQQNPFKKSSGDKQAVYNNSTSAQITVQSGSI